MLYVTLYSLFQIELNFNFSEGNYGYPNYVKFKQSYFILSAR